MQKVPAHSGREPGFERATFAILLTGDFVFVQTKSVESATTPSSFAATIIKIISGYLKSTK